MGKIVFAAVILYSLIFFPIYVSAYESCVNSSDNYAVEILLNKPGIIYNLTLLNNARNIIIENDKMIFRSQSNNQVAVILSQLKEFISAPIIRIQMPTKSTIKRIPYFKISSYPTYGELIVNNSGIKREWEIECSLNPRSKCVFWKENIIITITEIFEKKYILEAELINKEFSTCSDDCKGECVRYLIKNICIDESFISDVDHILSNTNIFKGFDKLKTQIKIESGSNNTVYIEPIYNNSVDFGEIAFKELLWLKDIGVIAVQLNDVYIISSFAKQGTAGNINRIVYGEDKNGEKNWLYNKDSKIPIIIEQDDCKEFPKSLLLSEKPAFKTSYISFYYLFPFFVLIAILILFLIILFVSRMFLKFKRYFKISH